MHLQPIDRLPDASSLKLKVGLPLRDRDTFNELIQQIYDPASTNYHHYLTPEQIAARFGPTETDYQAVIAFARTNGLAVIRTHSDRTLLSLEGPVANIEKALHVTMRIYQHPTEARTFYAPDAEPSLDLAVPILGISGLNDYILPQPGGHKESSSSNLATPGGGTAPGGTYWGKDYRAAYAPGVSLTGAGQTVGLLELDGYYANDITVYETQTGVPNVPLTNVLVDGFAGTPDGNANWVGEASLDIEMAISMAPGLSKVMVYETANCCYDWVDALKQMQLDNVAKQLSSSWLFDYDDPNATVIYQEFAAQGQSFFQCSGDYLAFYSGVPQWTDETNVTLVGGTMLSMSGSGGSWTSETTWNNGDGVHGSGGGVSASYLGNRAIPNYQQGINMTTNHGSTTKRNVPDVSMVAYQAWVISDNGSAGWWWGTSISAPLWAGFAALVNQQAAANGDPTIGFINPAVYAIGESAAYTNCFHDITTGNNINNNSLSLYSAVAGYDLCTGWGSPTGSNLINILAPPPSPLITAQPRDQNLIAGSSGTFNVLVIGATPLSFQWQFNGASLTDNGHVTGARTNMLSITNVQSADAGNYQIVVTNSHGSVTSSVAVLSLFIAPAITAQPQSQSVLAGTNATFVAETSGTAPLFYQWRFNGTNIASATGTSYTISNAQTNNQGNYSVVVTNFAGSVTSSNAVLTVDVPPFITVQPTNRIVVQGQAMAFGVTAGGTPTLSYQWQFNGSNIAGATASARLIPSPQPAQAGSYLVIITNNYGAVTSAVAVLTVLSPPAITTQPQSQSVNAGSNATFTVAATGTGLTYQWRFNTGAIVGATASSYTVFNSQTNNAGDYSVIVTNTAGSVISSNALLTVNPPQPPQFLSVTVLSNGPVQMVLSGQVGSTFAIDVSTDLSNWTQLVTFLNTNGSYQFTDAASTNHAIGFYRGRLVP